MKSVALAMIRFYQVSVSPTLPSSCRYHPTCSNYAFQAIEEWGLKRGLALAVQRVIRCQPFGGFGWDPVPLRNQPEDRNSPTCANSGSGSQGQEENHRTRME